MKCTTLALFLLDAASRTTGLGYNIDPMEDVVTRSTGGKKGGTNGGKKGDCTDGATEIFECETVISESGRYVLDNDISCNIFGIAIVADDVHLDCQGNKIQGSGFLSFFGIGIADADHVTVSNCEAMDFIAGLQADAALGRWTDLTVRDSTFHDNFLAGMRLEGRLVNPSEAIVVDSTFNDNGNAILGVGVTISNVDGNFVSSTMNNNVGFINSGFFATLAGESTLIDVTANGNLIGITSGIIPTVQVINSIACNNNFLDMLIGLTDTAQANTCDLSFPSVVGGFPVCQCLCDGSSAGSNAADVAMVLEDVDGPYAWVNEEENIFGIPRNETVAAAIESAKR
jgi:hypothetical protein